MANKENNPPKVYLYAIRKTSLGGGSVVIGVLLTHSFLQPHQVKADQATSRNLYAGKVLAIVQMTDETGEVSVTASAENLTSATVTFPVTGTDENQPTILTSYLAAKNIYLPKDGSLRLPKKVTVRYSDQTTATLPLKFDTDAIINALATGESFVAQGELSDTGLKIDFQVSVIDQIGALKNISLATEVGQTPNLPATIQSYQNDGTLLAAQFPVTWQLPAPEVFNQVGNVKIEGIADVLGEKLPVTAMVRIAKKR